MRSITAGPTPIKPKKNRNNVNGNPEINPLQTRVLSTSENDNDQDSLQSAPRSPSDVNEPNTTQKVDATRLLTICSDNRMSMTKKLTAMEQLRLIVFNKRYPYPHYCRHVSLFCIIVLSSICGVITIIWCLWFEGSLEVENGYDNEVQLYDNCEIDVTPLQTKLNYDASQATMEKRLEVFELNGNSFYNPPSGDSFDSNIGLLFEELTISRRFLLCVSISFVLTIFVWQPLFIASKTLITLCGYRLKSQLMINDGLLFYNIEARRPVASLNQGKATQIALAEQIRTVKAGLRHTSADENVNNIDNNIDDVFASDHGETDDELQVIFDNSPITAGAGCEGLSDNEDREPKQIKYVLNQIKPQTTSEMTINKKSKTKTNHKTTRSKITTK